MKNITLTSAFLKILLLVIAVMTSCSTEENIRPTENDPMTEARALEDPSARKRTQPVSAFTYNGRRYDFIYDAEGRVTTVTASEGSILYTYVTTYEGDQLISSNLVEGDKVMSSNTNFQFDKKGRIIAYDYVSYFYPEYPEGLVTHYTLGYDKKGNLIKMYDGSILQYDNHHNVIQWGSRVLTYENKTNPLNVVDDLWLIFVEEPYIAEFSLSQNVSTSQLLSNGIMVVYQNEYNESGLLIRKTATINGSVNEVLEFFY
jgi:YD repeat-containing protein